MIDRMIEICDAICGKQYRAGYNPWYNEHNCSDLEWITGELVNYNNGNIIIFNEDKGLFHIPYKSLKWLIPIKNQKNK